ncbi:MAG: hypothetical protein OXQ31_19105, partial [Spirochaetaceae bacterium]|nr:hypothetical protein [Spirochaetaceae bacterium]
GDRSILPRRLHPPSGGDGKIARCARQTVAALRAATEPTRLAELTSASVPPALDEARRATSTAPRGAAHTDRADRQFPEAQQRASSCRDEYSADLAAPHATGKDRMGLLESRTAALGQTRIRSNT